MALNCIAKRIGCLIRSPLLLTLRVVFGLSLAHLGMTKFQGLPGTVGYFNSIGVPFPDYTAVAVASVELFGGLLLAVGLWSYFASLSIFVVMSGAYFFGHPEESAKLFEDPLAFSKGPPFLFLITSLIVLISGPGFFSLDHLWGGSSSKHKTD